MKNSLLVNKYIITLLKQNKELMKLVPAKRIFSIDAKQGTTFPFIVTSRLSVIPAYSKDGCYEDEVRVSVIIVDTTYAGSVEIANLVRASLERHRYEDEDVKITDILMTSASENWYDNAFLQQLEFNVKFQK